MGFETKKREKSLFFVTSMSEIPLDLLDLDFINVMMHGAKPTCGFQTCIYRMLEKMYAAGDIDNPIANNLRGMLSSLSGKDDGWGTTAKIDYEWFLDYVTIVYMQDNTTTYRLTKMGCGHKIVIATIEDYVRCRFRKAIQLERSSSLK